MGKADHLKKYHFKKGVSPNPGGQSAQQAAAARLIAKDALDARAILVKGLLAQVQDAAEVKDDNDTPADAARRVALLSTQNNLKLLTDSENRGLGTPTQQVKMESKNEHGPVGSITRRVVDPDHGPRDTDSEVGDTPSGD